MPAGKHKPGYRRPRAGERRKADQPFKVDRLPLAVRDQIEDLRAKEGRSFGEIEELSAKFVPWEELAPTVRLLFPKQVISERRLRSWYTVRVKQRLDESRERSEASHAFAAALLETEYKDLPQSVMNALADRVFEVTQMARKGDFKGEIQALHALALAVSKLRRTAVHEKRIELEEQHQQLERDKFEQARKNLEQETDRVSQKLQQGKPVTAEDIARIRRRTFGEPPKQ